MHIISNRYEFIPVWEICSEYPHLDYAVDFPPGRWIYYGQRHEKAFVILGDFGDRRLCFKSKEDAVYYAVTSHRGRVHAIKREAKMPKEDLLYMETLEQTEKGIRKHILYARFKQFYAHPDSIFSIATESYTRFTD